MRDCNRGQLRKQIRFLRHQFLQDGEMPFGEMLSDKLVNQALIAAGVVWNERIYSPVVTLWMGEEKGDAAQKRNNELRPLLPFTFYIFVSVQYLHHMGVKSTMTRAT